MTASPTLHLPVLPTPSQASALTLDPHTYARGLSCVHCGLCLPVCPTYTQTWNEADSPRGRIELMLALSDGKIAPTESVQKHLDLCLDCRACETICPSGVIYHELIEGMRPKLHAARRQSVSSHLLRWVFLHIVTHPTRLKLAMLPARLMKRLDLLNWLPASMKKMAAITPMEGRAFPAPLPEFVRGKPTHKPKVRVAFFQTCVGSVMYDRVNRQAIELLSACGADVLVIPANHCCGAIHHHNDASQNAQEMARRNIDALKLGTADAPDLITSTVAGCGAMLHDYPYLLRDYAAYRDRAEQFASRVRDISQVLLQLGLPEMKTPVNETVSYHDACHLVHAQQVSVEPRKLLMQIPGIKLIALPESDTCCGAAGTYNLTHPQMASELAERKLRNIAATGCRTLVAGNVGCAMHIQAEANARGNVLTIVHPVELLHRAVFGG